jgi:hypothetical protein
MPNDEDEQSRMQMLNTIYYSLLGERLTTVPLDNPQKILDVGTGNGEWAMAMGDEYPDAEVIGTDLARIQPTAAPMNVFFEVDDAEADGGWAWAEDEFDFIHLRYLCGAFKSWKYIYGEAFKHLKPGGWIEVLDFDDHRGLMGFFPPEENRFPYWLKCIVEGTRMSGRPRTITHLEPPSLEELGFVDVKSTVFDIPMGVWPEDAELRKSGKHFLVAILLGLESVCLRPLVEQMGWAVEDVRDICETVAQEVWSLAVKDPERAQGFGFKLKVLVGRKPENP